MPYKCEGKGILLGKFDRRRKLDDAKRAEIRILHARGRSLNALAKEYKVSKKTILNTVNPESNAKSIAHTRNHWREYQPSAEAHAESMRKTRIYRHRLFVEGKI